MKKSLHDYLLGVKKESTIIIRTTVPMTDELMDKLETYLKRYELVKVSPPAKTIHQKWALGFTTPVNSEVWIIEATLGMPVAITTMPYELGTALGYSEARFVVHFEGENLELPKEANEIKVMEINKSDKDKKEYQKHIDAQQEATVDASELYGDEYNKNMLKAAIDYRAKQNKEQEKKVKDIEKSNKKK